MPGLFNGADLLGSRSVCSKTNSQSQWHEITATHLKGWFLRSPFSVSSTYGSSLLIISDVLPEFTYSCSLVFMCCVSAGPVRRNPSSDDDLALGVEGKYCPNLDLSGTVSCRASAHALSTANFPTPVFCLLRSLECFITISQHECRAGAHIT